MAAPIEEIRRRVRVYGTEVWMPQGMSADVLAVRETIALTRHSTQKVMLTFGYKYISKLETGKVPIYYYEKIMA